MPGFVPRLTPRPTFFFLCLCTKNQMIRISRHTVRKLLLRHRERGHCSFCLASRRPLIPKTISSNISPQILFYASLPECLPRICCNIFFARRDNAPLSNAFLFRVRDQAARPFFLSVPAPDRIPAVNCILCAFSKRATKRAMFLGWTAGLILTTLSSSTGMVYSSHTVLLYADMQSFLPASPSTSSPWITPHESVNCRYTYSLRTYIDI